MKWLPKKSIAVFPLVLVLVLTMGVLSSPADPLEQDPAKGEYDSYLYGAAANEVLMFTSTATGDVNGDGYPDLIMGHAQGGTTLPFLYTGKVYVYYGGNLFNKDVDLGTN